MERVTMEIGGMSCGHCVRAVEQGQGVVDGVQVEGEKIVCTIGYKKMYGTSVVGMMNVKEDE